MKTIRNWRNLEEYGILLLTGEADPYCMRGLCDLTPAGKRILEEFFGVSELTLPPNWNSRQGQVASILLHYDLLIPLAKFILYHIENFEKIGIASDGSITGFNVGDIEEEYYDSYFEKRVWTNPNPHRDRLRINKNRNEHQFTGRTF